MKRMSIILLWLLLTMVFACSKPESNIIRLNSGWKFITGDNLEYARPDFPDSSWQTIHPDRAWEEQGVGEYDGFTWYRIKFFLPGDLKERSLYQDSLQIFLGQIDDTDQTFLNGYWIGENGEFIPRKKADNPGSLQGLPGAYQRNRCYILSVKDERILWNQENTLAIRVLDTGGPGGLISPVHEIKMIDLPDYLIIDNKSEPFTVVNRTQFSKKIILKNISSRKVFNGIFSIKIQNTENGKTVHEQEMNVKMINGRSMTFPFHFTTSEAENCIAIYEFIEQTKKIKVSLSEEIPYILTPSPPDEPVINGPKVYGVRAGKPILYKIPATGDRPVTFSVENLPEGLFLESETGIITGRIHQAGEYPVLLVAENAKGRDSREFRFVVGDEIALTPPMGWNSWNCWGLSVDEEKVRTTADYMESTDLINYGWTYINIDDGWESPKRNFKGEIIPNDQFPNMKELADYVHNKGLKLGIYSSPGTLTCGGYLGSYQYEAQDARAFARWGIDYLKYDWCSYNDIAVDHTLPELKKPYFLMRDKLLAQNRDVVFSLCQYGMGDVWRWGAEVGGNTWRTTGDIIDTWTSMCRIGFAQTEQWQYARPGHWNDPDMLVVGWVGWGPELHPTRLTVNEQYTHISLWSLLSAPLLLGCDLSKLDDFTLGLLTNAEVLAVNQDALGKQAQKLFSKDSTQIWAKTLEDGSKAVGLFNLSSQKKKIKLDWKLLDLTGSHTVRDLWRQKDLGSFKTDFETKVPVHGVVLVKVN